MWQNGSTWAGFAEYYVELAWALSVLSGGAVGFGDLAGATNRSLLMTACREDGVLLGASLPSFYIDDVYRPAGSVAGLLITEGTLTKGASLYRVLRGEEVVHEAPALATLRHLQNNVDAAKKGTECGITVDGWGGWKLGDKLLAVKVKAVTKRLEVRWD
jgi:hypothetical protein